MFFFINLSITYCFISKRLEQLQYLINHSKTKITSEVKGSINNNIAKLQKDIKNLETNFETEKDNLLLFSKYNNQIISIRKQFSVSRYIYFISLMIIIILDLYNIYFCRMNYKHYFLMLDLKTKT